MYILRAAVNGDTREELIENLITLAKDMLAHKNSNAMGYLPVFDFDYQIDDFEEGDIVSVYIKD